MSKKRTSTGSSNDDQTNEGSDAHEDENAKRARLASLSDTTLQDLPIELLECILVEVVAMEVKGMRLAKRVWKEKADLVINRLCTVCSQWTNTLTSNFFRNELHRTLDGTAEKTIRLEILHQFPIHGVMYISALTTLNGEIIMLCECDSVYSLIVYKRDDMTEVKDVIPLQGLQPKAVAACNVSNCVYILNLERRNNYSVMRITLGLDAEPTYAIDAFLTEFIFSNPNLTVLGNGFLVLTHQKVGKTATSFVVFNQHGLLVNRGNAFSQLAPCRDCVAKFNGNVLLVSFNKSSQAVLSEVDLNGTIIRQYLSDLGPLSSACASDQYGRMILAESSGRIELLDSEFNTLDLVRPDIDNVVFCTDLHYDKNRNEIMAITESDSENSVLTIFRCDEDF